MGHGADAIELRGGLNTTDFYVACVGGLDAATHFTKPECFVSRAAFIAELRRLVAQPTEPSRTVPSVEEYQRAQRRWLENTLSSYETS